MDKGKTNKAKSNILYIFISVYLKVDYSIAPWSIQAFINANWLAGKLW